MLQEQREITFIECLEMFVLLLLTVGPIDQQYKLVIYLVLIFYNIIFHKETRIIQISNIHIIVICLMLIPMLLDIRNVDSNNPYSLAGFAFLIPFVVSVLYLKRYDADTFMMILEKTALVISAISIVGTVLVIYTPNIVLSFPKILFYERPAYTIIVYNAVNAWVGGGLLQRNCGCAYEPGAFQLVCNLGLAITMNNTESPLHEKLIKATIYSAAVLLTKSTTGLIIMALIFVISLFKGKRNFWTFLLIAVIMSGAIYTALQYQSAKLETGNFESRFNNSIYVIKNYWTYFFGLGSTGYNKAYKITSNIGSWDAYTNLFLRFGYPFIICFIHLVLKTKRVSIMICIVLLLTFLTETTVGPITVLLLYYSCKYKSGHVKLMNKKGRYLK